MKSIKYSLSESKSLLSEKKRLGAFYTPRALSDILCEWAIRKPSDLILEPSFGGCGFLKSAAQRFKNLELSSARSQIFGCDIDPKAFSILSEDIGELVDLSHFEQCDFLTFQGKDTWPDTFDVVLGNPPYVPYQSISPEVREKALNRIKALGVSVDLRSSMWVYFVVLALNLLSKGGRIAWVLPGSFLQANYAKPLRLFLQSQFERIHAFQIQERLFLYEGTDEQTIVLLGENYLYPSQGRRNDDIKLTSCHASTNLIDAVKIWDEGNSGECSICGSEIVDSFNTKSRILYESLLNSAACVLFGEIASVRIGLVTGDNKFFLLNYKTTLENGLNNSSLSPTLGKFASAPGLIFTESDHTEDRTTDRRCLLVSAEKLDGRRRNLVRYLGSYPEEKINSVSTYKKRKVWFRVDDGNIPDAFFPVMHHLGPRLVLNQMGVNCTNTIHRVYFNESITQTEKYLLSISLLSTFSQLSAEVAGRKYGSGVLKHEPREAENIHVLLPPIENWREVKKTFRKIDDLLRAGDTSGARLSADQFILEPILEGKYNAAQKLLDECLIFVRERRHPGRKK